MGGGEELGRLQQQWAVALERFIQASRTTQREVTAAHSSVIDHFEILQRFTELTREETLAFERYVDLRHQIFRCIKTRMSDKRSKQAPAAKGPQKNDRRKRRV
jgi:hypothetical protein